MKSIKPGRGPSAMGAIGSVAIGVFGIFWTIGAASMGAPTFFVLFGVVFVGIAIVQAIYHFKNATGKNRMSLYDITDKEPDPIEQILNMRSKQKHQDFDESHSHQDFIYCPYCGDKLGEASYHFCPKCGSKLKE